MQKLPPTLVILALGALIAFPQYASAQANSGIDQYEENIPGAGGDHPAGGGGTGSGGGGGGSGSESADPGSAGSGSQPAPAETADAGKAPESGAGRVDVAKSDASGSRQDGSRQDKDKDKGKGKGKGENVTSVAAEGSGPADPVSTVQDTAGDGGMGVVLPIILGASALAALGLLVARRRRGSAHAPPA